ncbi:MAG: nucleotide exchange factor GrpE [Deltaproteobacteria bacterium]|nr:nucleotide exchange factor GrpE [Deltaproteobacteria bacterium]
MSDNTEAPDEQTTISDDALASMTADRDRFKDAALRALADLDNFRKRAVREREDTAKRAREDVLRELLPVFDNLERASQYVSQGVDGSAVSKGIEMVLKLFDDTLARLGGKRMRPVGSSFDPQIHEAISQQPSTEYSAGVVVAEAVPGYMLSDRLLRAAMVVVSTGPGPTAAPAERAPVNVEEELEFDPRDG